MASILVIRAEEGRVVEKRIVEGDLVEVVKQVAREAFEEWDPAGSDFLVIRDFKEIDIPFESVTPELFDVLRDYGITKKEVEGELRASFTLPVYTISFENEMIGDEMSLEKKIYMIVPHIMDEVDAIFEKLAADITSPQAVLEGIEEA